MASYMRFTTLYREIAATYPEKSKAYHVLATRYYIGADTADDLHRQARPIQYGRFEGRPMLTTKEAETIIRNR